MRMIRAVLATNEYVSGTVKQALVALVDFVIEQQEARVKSKLIRYECRPRFRKFPFNASAESIPA